MPKLYGKDASGAWSETGAFVVEGGSGTELISYANTLLRVFQNTDFSDNPNVSISLKKVPASCQDAFSGSTGVETITLKSPEGQLNMNSAFNKCSAVVIDLTDFPRQFLNVASAFASAINLREIKGELDFSTATNINTSFRYSSSLETVRFKAGSIKSSIEFGATLKLTDTTIQSIIDGLADLTGSTAQTLTLHADVKSKLTETQISTITGKNWTLA